MSLFKLFFRVNGGERDQTLRFYFDVDFRREELHWGRIPNLSCKAMLLFRCVYFFHKRALVKRVSLSRNRVTVSYINLRTVDCFVFGC